VPRVPAGLDGDAASAGDGPVGAVGGWGKAAACGVLVGGM